MVKVTQKKSLRGLTRKELFTAVSLRVALSSTTVNLFRVGRNLLQYLIQKNQHEYLVSNKPMFTPTYLKLILESMR